MAKQRLTLHRGEDYAVAMLASETTETASITFANDSAAFQRKVVDRFNDSSADLEAALLRADRIIGWMAGHVGRMCPPPDGLAKLNEHWLFMQARGVVSNGEPHGATLDQRDYERGLRNAQARRLGDD